MQSNEELFVIGKYRVIGTLGRGAMGVVYKAQDPEIGRIVAVKVLRSIDSVTDDALKAAIESFKDEARSAGNLRHPRIITVFEVSSQGKSPYIVMDFIDGQGLDQVLARQGALAPGVALQILRQIAEGLDYAHERGVIHRDIKPSNILIDQEQGAFIVDFGVATFGRKAIEAGGPVVGSPGYMSPEQILAKQITYRSDLFGFAIVAFEMLSGFRPFDGENFNAVVSQILNNAPRSFSSLKPECPLEVEMTLEKALSKDSAQRFNNATEFILALEEAFGIASKSRSTRAEGVRQTERKLTDWNPLGVDGSIKRQQSSLPSVNAAPPGINKSASVEQGWDRPTSGLVGSSASNTSTTGYVRSSGRPGATYSQGESLSSKRPSGYSNLNRLILFLLALISISVGGLIIYFVLTPAEPISTSTLNNSPITIAPPDLELPEALPKDRYDIPSLSQRVDELNERQILGLLVKGEFPIEDILKAIGIANENNIVGRHEAFVHLLNNDSYVVRVEAIKALAKSMERRFGPAILVALEDHDPLVRIAAAHAIRELGDRKSVSYLSSRMASEELPEVRGALRKAIEQLNGFPMAE